MMRNFREWKTSYGGASPAKEVRSKEAVSSRTTIDLSPGS
ncbi:hypothetical protein COLO4_36868 [Corchorus olitorius]|uniref:Uncharacterized protein n=1 Tax=Corchorus olitorius TaxID=93759 RepID=A0A1R3G4P4_9ROSI|nr:hypothetical protein COLO4_36868 [Corchorus olitorius]